MSRWGTEAVVLAAALLLTAMPVLTVQAAAVFQTNAVANPGFENPLSNPWHKSSTYGNGTVNIHDNTRPHGGSYSAMLSALNKTLLCSSSECKDTVRATVEQYVQFNSPPTLSHLSNAKNSFSAWWYVATSGGLPTYSLHIGLSFTDGTSIEYWYGISDLSNQQYNLGSIPSTGSWFQMSRNLTADIQGVVADPSTTRITTLWFGAFGGSYCQPLPCQGTPHGETAWVDDVVLNFHAGPVAVFSSSPASGPAPLTVKFNASQSYDTGGSSASIVSYQWNFGDGTMGTGQTTSHSYATSGTYHVTLTITDSNGVESRPSSIVITVGLSDATIPLLVGGGGGVLLLGGFFLTKSRRSSKTKRARPKLRKG